MTTDEALLSLTQHWAASPERDSLDALADAVAHSTDGLTARLGALLLTTGDHDPDRLTAALEDVSLADHRATGFGCWDQHEHCCAWACPTCAGRGDCDECGGRFLCDRDDALAVLRELVAEHDRSGELADIERVAALVAS